MSRRQMTWISGEVIKPTAEDADAYERVWAIALDALGRPYPCEAYWQHVADCRNVIYTHWMRPEWGVDWKRDRRKP